MSSGPVSHQSSLATAPPGPLNRRLAVLAIMVSGVCFAVMAPFARTHLTAIPAFVPAYESALAINDLITSILLFGHFARLRRRSLLVISAGYLFNVCMIVVHALSFPGVFSVTGLLGSGPQTTAWLYVFWHGGFPAFLLAYALLANSGRDSLSAGTRPGIFAGIVVVTVAILAIVFTFVSTVGQEMLPAIIVGGDYSRMVTIGISPALLALTALGIVAMWRRRNTTLLDVWLFAVLWVWICDVSLSAVVGSARFDLGWYGGRLFGLFAASFVLGALLLELDKLYAHLSDALTEAEARNAELVRSRSELVRVQRFEALGQLTGGIAHDFNNLLTAIVGGLDMIVRKPAETEKVERLAANALKAANRGTRLISQLMTFARKQNLKPEVVNPNALLFEFEAFARRVAGEPIEVMFELSQAIYPVRVDAGQFQAAMLNLISNARDAMPSGGTLRIESDNVELERAVSGGEPFEAMAGSYAMISVSDTGVGMDADTIAKVFEPFFTTKAVGQGTGLGLSQVYGFARSANGMVTIASEPGRGSKLTIYIPRSMESYLGRPGTDHMPLRPAQAGETVLLVEDDPDVLAATEESLNDLGYTVVSAITAQAALVILQQNRVDILFSDVVMPGGMNGVQLAIEARRLRPDLRVLLTSGYTGTALSQHGIPIDLPLLGKPYHRDELASKLRVVLHGR